MKTTFQSSEVASVGDLVGGVEWEDVRVGMRERAAGTRREGETRPFGLSMILVEPLYVKIKFQHFYFRWHTYSIIYLKH